MNPPTRPPKAEWRTRSNSPKPTSCPPRRTCCPQYATFADVEAACAAVRHRDQCPRAPHHWPASRSRCSPRNAPPACGARSTAHRRTRSDTPSPRQHPDGHLRTLPILVTSNTIGAKCVDPTPRRHRRGRHLRSRRRRPGGSGATPPRHPGKPRHRRQPFPRPPRQDSRRLPHPGPHRLRADVPGPRPRRGGVAQRGGRGRHRTDYSEDGPRGRTLRAGRPRRCRLGAGSCRGARPLRHRRSRFHPRHQRPGPHPSRRREDTSLAQGTSGWNLFGPTSSMHPRQVSHEHHHQPRRCPPTSKP